MDLLRRGNWSRWRRSEGVNRGTQSESDRAHCRGPAQVLPSIYLQPPQSTSYPTSAYACVCVCLWDASYTPKKNTHTHWNVSPNKWRWFNTPGQQWRRKQLRPHCPPLLRSAAAQQKGRQGKVGQSDLCAWRVKRSELAKGTGHVRALLLTAGEEDAHGQGPKGANSACWDRHTYAHIPVLTQGRTPATKGEEESQCAQESHDSDVNKSMSPLVVGLLTFMSSSCNFIPLNNVYKTIRMRCAGSQTNKHSANSYISHNMRYISPVVIAETKWESEMT